VLQLKFHLGLIVPQAPDGKPCATMRVGNETRAWRAGKVLFFDDSWEHEVWNRCQAERAIFQLVFVHPDLQQRLPQLSADGH
jgi:beta-hydroxylase